MYRFSKNKLRVRRKQSDLDQRTFLMFFKRNSYRFFFEIKDNTTFSFLKTELFYNIFLEVVIKYQT